MIPNISGAARIDSCIVIYMATKRTLNTFWNKRKKGQTLVEYALILAFISVVVISVLIGLGGRIKTVFTTITSQLAIAGSSH
jgi:Flp pilus assembly pilin Flp